MNNKKSKITSISVKANAREDASYVLLGMTLGKNTKAADLLPSKLAWKDYPDNDASDWWDIPNKYDSANKPAPWEKGFDFCKDTPAGSKGWLIVKNGNFVFENEPENPVRFKGITVVKYGFFPFKAMAARYAKIMQKYGFNQIRFHSLFDVLLKSDGNYKLPEYNPKRMAKFDKLFYELKKAGIYVRMSGLFSTRWSPSTGVQVPAKISALNNTQYFYDEKHQELYLKCLKKFLEHTNPYTKLRYADDPAFSTYKIINEVSLFFNTVDASPGPYRLMLQEQYNNWLIKKYENDITLTMAWRIEGSGSPMNQSESLTKGTVALLGIGSLANCASAHIKRAADQTQFYYELEQKWFKKVKKLIRSTGSKMLVQGSSWGGPGHLQELQAATNTCLDFTGKHCYWLHPHGGWSPREALFGNEPIVKHPVDHMLTGAFQNVSGKPFAITEWNFCFPNDYFVDAAPFMAIYGALQNINANHRFCMGTPEIQSVKNDFFSIFASPGGLTTEPMSYFLYVRGDLKQAPVIYQNYLFPEALHNPKRNKSEDKTSSDNRFYMKFAKGNIPTEAMLVGGVRLSFDKEKYPPIWNEKLYKKAHNKEAGTITSITNEVVWDYKNYNITVKTPKTRGILGFLNGDTYKNGPLTMKLNDAYGVVSLSSIDNLPLEKSKEILLTMVGRERNSNQTLQELTRNGKRIPGRENTRMGQIGTAPIISEPIEIELILKTEQKGVWKVIPLDATGKTIDNEEFTAIADKNLNLSFSNKTYKSFNFLLKKE